MNKTLSITLGGLIFHIEEDAYSRLNVYLDEIKTRFAHLPDQQDIMVDIEANIAEKFSAKISPAKAAINLSDVEEVISLLGTSADFGEDTSTSTTGASAKKNFKKLYRNPDDQIIAGVCSGIAAYFGTQALLIRLLFFISVFFGGFGILLYIILWIIVPEAKTSSQKLEMNGDPVTLKGIEQVVKENVDKINTPENKERIKSSFRKLIEFPFVVLKALAKALEKFFRFLGPILGAIIGALMSIFAFSGICFFSWVLVVALFNIQNPYLISDIPLDSIFSQPLFRLGVIAAYAAIIIPGLFVLISGVSLARRKNSFSWPLVSALIAIWMVSLVAAGSIAFRYAPDIENKVNEYQKQQHISKSYDLKDFKGITAADNIRLSVQKADTYSVKADGNRDAVERIKAEIKDGQLYISRSYGEGRLCFFCLAGGPLTVTVTMPQMENLEANDASSVSASGFSEKSLRLVFADASRGELTLDAKEMDISLKDASRLTLAHLTPKNNQNMKVSVKDASRLDAEEFEARNASVNLEDASRAYISLSGTLSAKLRDASRLEYRGAEKVIEDSRDASRVVNKDVVKDEEAE